jgi:hypothetical protein
VCVPKEILFRVVSMLELLMLVEKLPISLIAIDIEVNREIHHPVGKILPKFVY